MALLYVVAHTPVGVFEGSVNGDPTAAASDLAQIRDAIQAQLQTMTYMVLYTNFKNLNENQISLSGDMIRRSVISFSVRED